MKNRMITFFRVGEFPATVRVRLRRMGLLLFFFFVSTAALHAQVGGTLKFHTAPSQSVDENSTAVTDSVVLNWSADANADGTDEGGNKLAAVTFKITVAPGATAVSGNLYILGLLRGNLISNPAQYSFSFAVAADGLSATVAILSNHRNYDIGTIADDAPPLPPNSTLHRGLRTLVRIRFATAPVNFTETHTFSISNANVVARNNKDYTPTATSKLAVTVNKLGSTVFRPGNVTGSGATDVRDIVGIVEDILGVGGLNVMFAAGNSGAMYKEINLTTLTDGAFVAKALVTSTGATANYGLNGVHFINNSTGWVVGQNETTSSSGTGIVRYTPNEGSHWIDQTASLSAVATAPFYTVFSRSPDLAWIGGGSATGGTTAADFYKTTNGGTTWTKIITGSTQNIRAIYFVDSDYGWFVGDNGTVFKSIDGGTTWAAQTAAASYIGTLRSAYFIDRNNGYAVGNAVAGTPATSYLMKTTDGGGSWTRLVDAVTLARTQDLYNVYMLSTTLAFAVGNGNTVLLLSGATPTVAVLTGITLKDWRGINSWQVAASTTTTGYRAILVASDGSAAILPHGTTGGGTITQASTGVPMPGGSGFTGYNALWITSQNEVTADVFPLYASTATAGSAAGSRDFKVNLSDVILTQNAILTGLWDNGTPAASIGGGIAPPDISLSLGGLTGQPESPFAEKSTSAAVVDLIFEHTPRYITLKMKNDVPVKGIQVELRVAEGSSNDDLFPMLRAKNMYAEDRFDGLDYRMILRTAENAAWVKPGEGSILRIPLLAKTVDDIQIRRVIVAGPNTEKLNVAIKFVEIERANDVPYRFELVQNYPNPFNPETKIQFEVPEIRGSLANILVQVYNLLGEKVKTLAKGEHEPGRYTVVWDGSNDHGQKISSGVYFYRYINLTGGNQAAKKMLLLR